MTLRRPTFIAAAATALGALSLGRGVKAETMTTTTTTEIPKRRLGRTNQHVSIIGMGGFHLGKADLPDSDAIKLVHSGLDRGITFLDNSWDYNMGNSELRVGRALQIPSYREKAFLMTKIDGRTKESFNKQFDESLHRLLVDHVDLVQFHENIRPDDADRIFAPGGALEAAIAVRQAGKTRFIGFTGHKNPDYHLHMLELADKHGFAFDTVQMPLNVMDAHYESFEKKVLPEAKKRDIGVIAMKTFGDHAILDTGAVSPVEMLHYGMNLPTSVVVTGIDKPAILEQAIVAATTFKPLGATHLAAILAKTQQLAQGGKSELYKSTHYFDSTFQNPQWLG